MKTLKGKIISDKMEKTATVLIERKYKHPLYGKILKKNRKIHADNRIGAKIGDVVFIVEVKPISKMKNFMIKEVIELKKQKETK